MRHAGDRLRPRIDARADRRRRHRLSGRYFDEAVAAIARVGEIDRAACRAHVAERFSVERMAEGYVGVYERVLRK